MSRTKKKIQLATIRELVKPFGCLFTFLLPAKLLHCFPSLFSEQAENGINSQISLAPLAILGGKRKL